MSSIAQLIFAVFGGLVSMSRYSSEGGTSAGSSGSGQLRNSWKCCAHLADLLLFSCYHLSLFVFHQHGVVCVVTAAIA